MKQPCDIFILGTGYFAEIMLGDIAATSRGPVAVVVAGRNQARMAWLVAAANARAAIFGSAARFVAQPIDMGSTESIAEGIGRWEPRVVVQSASLQSPWSVDGVGSRWAALVNQAGFGITVALQSLLPVRTAAALQALGSQAAFVNTCYPDVVNQVIRARGLPIACGVGNVAIFAAVATSLLAPAQAAALRVLGHHRHLVEWRKPGAERGGQPVRVWVGAEELDAQTCHFREVQLPFRELNVVSGASAVPVLLALAGAAECRAHVPGPAGLPGGYPVRVIAGQVVLDLPAGVSETDAVGWNRQFEALDGASVSADGWVGYSDTARSALDKVSPAVAQGFAVGDLENAYLAVSSLRQALGG